MIEIKNASIIHSDGTYGIEELNLHIHKGEKIAAIGANGAGKTSLLGGLTGLKAISQGSILIKDMEVSKENYQKIRRLVGYVFQNPDDQLFMPAVYDDMAFGLRNQGIDETEIEAKVKKTLENLGISHLKDRFHRKLSGGEQHLTALGTILCMEPEVLLLDEPTGGLDPRARKRLIQVLKEIDMTMILTTHDLDMIFGLCERVVLLKQGHLQADGEPAEILENEKLLKDSNLELPICVEAIRKWKEGI